MIFVSVLLLTGEIMKTTILLTLLIGLLVGCSKPELKIGENLQFDSSPEQQSLLISMDKNNPLQNEYLYTQSKRNNYGFYDFIVNEPMTLNFTAGATTGVNCSIEELAYQLKWEEVLSNNVILRGEGTEFKADTNKRYRLRVNLAEIPNCEYMGFYFYVSGEVISDTKLPTEVLQLKKGVYLNSPVNSKGNVIKDFTYSNFTLHKQTLYFAYTSEGIDSSCERTSSIKIQWLTLDDQNQIVHKKDVKDFDDMDAEPQQKYILRITFVKPYLCQFMSTSFQVDFY